MGRDWNEKLSRRLGDSICCARRASPQFLVTDLEDSNLSLVEVLDPDGDRVIGEFLIAMGRPSDEQGAYREVVYLEDVLS